VAAGFGKEESPAQEIGTETVSGGSHGQAVIFVVGSGIGVADLRRDRSMIFVDQKNSGEESTDMKTIKENAS
jgi:hypothetical protein